VAINLSSEESRENSRVRIQIGILNKIQTVRSCHTLILSTKFCPNLSITFWDILLTDRQTHRQGWIRNLHPPSVAEVTSMPLHLRACHPSPILFVFWWWMLICQHYLFKVYDIVWWYSGQNLCIEFVVKLALPVVVGRSVVYFQHRHGGLNGFLRPKL